MPIYEYRCEKCSQEFELLIRGKDKPVCPYCGERNLARRMSVPSAHSSSSETSTCPGAAAGCPQKSPSCCGGRGCACH
ncbi:MAG: zinc ribbon domain-containing protein [Planctomycetaceae bacterium]|nr:zinc ribbon domain-containing protein [Planctomycetaceae bacterium]